MLYYYNIKNKILVTIFGLLILGCNTKSEFSSLLDSTPTDNLSTYSKLEFNSTTNTEYLPFKVLLFIDDSYTMSLSQEKISAAMDSLLLPMRGKNVTLQLLTTSDTLVADNYRTSSILTEFRELNSGNFVLSKVNQSLISLISGNYIFGDMTPKSDKLKPEEILLFKDDLSYQLRLYPIPFNINTNSLNHYEFLSSDSNNDWDQKLLKLKNRIKNIGTTGSDSEKFMCPLLRFLKNKNLSHPFLKFNPNDRIAFVLLTDEDDSSKADTCIQSYDFTYGALDASIFKITYYFPDLIGSYIEPAHEQTRDGVVIQVPERERTFRVSEVDDFSTLKNMGIDSSEIQSNSCSDHALAILDKYVKEESSFKDKPGVKISRCKKATSTFTSKVFSTTSNLCSNPNSINPDQDPDYIQSCTQHLVRALSSSKLNYFIDPSSSKQDLINYTLNSIKEISGENFFMSFIINPQNGSCNLANGQSIGSTYEQMASMLAASRTNIIPICNESYDQALEKLSQYSEEVYVTTYEITAEINDSSIYQIHIKSKNGKNRILSKEEYEVKDSKLFLKSNLNNGDIITIYYKNSSF